MEKAIGAPGEVSSSNSHAILIAEISDLRELLRSTIIEGKKVLTLLPREAQRALLGQLLKADFQLRGQRTPGEKLHWEGVTWTKQGKPELPHEVACDGCQSKITTGHQYLGDDGSLALWCEDCNETVKSDPINR